MPDKWWGPEAARWGEEENAASNASTRLGVTVHRIKILMESREYISPVF